MKKLRFTTIIALLLIVLANADFGQFGQSADGGPTLNTREALKVSLSEKRIQHILYGDGTGGGHRHGANKPCKSEFPASWSDEKIIETVKKIAANDNTDWTVQDNGNAVADTQIENLKIRVVMNPETAEVITAYPTNVRRNPCPAANDNNR